MIPVFYNPKSVSTTNSFSPSGHKPDLVAHRWKGVESYGVKFLPHQGLHPKEISRAHDPKYVEAICTGKTNNGFGSRDLDVAKSCLYTCGGMLAAAQHVLDLEGEDLFACAPYSGFHHAGYDFGGGFCTFNGLMTTAVTLLETYQVDKLLILDCDYHYGNGTQDIMDRCPSDFTGFITHWTAGENYQNKYEADDFLAELKEVLEANKNTGLILYQAGADPHVRDPLGGFLTSKQMRARDRLVFDKAREYGIPVVWNLAGGYQDPIEKVLKLHDQTLIEALASLV